MASSDSTMRFWTPCATPARIWPTFVDLNASQVLNALDTLARMQGLKASAAHDFLHIRAGELSNAQALVTLNLAEWAQLTTLKCELPVKP